jgi:hypothetical protein
MKKLLIITLILIGAHKYHKYICRGLAHCSHEIKKASKALWPSSGGIDRVRFVINCFNSPNIAMNNFLIRIELHHIEHNADYTNYIRYYTLSKCIVFCG